MADKMQTYLNGVLYRQWDDNTSTYSEFDSLGNVTFSRPYSTDENTAANVRASLANIQTVMNKAQQAITNNVAYLGIASPSNTQVITQVTALTRQVDALIHIALNLTDSQGT